MVPSKGGATYGDAIIFTVRFAERHPWRFLLTIPLTLGIGLTIMLLVLKFGVIGAVQAHKTEYDEKRVKAQTENSKPDS